MRLFNNSQVLSNSTEICWLVQKKPVTSVHGFKTFQEFLDNEQYTRDSILRCERVCDEHFASIGGLETTEVGAYKSYVGVLLTALLSLNVSHLVECSTLIFTTDLASI